MATTIKLIPASSTVAWGTFVKFTTEVTGQPADSTLTYAWHVDDIVMPGYTDASFELGKSALGTHKVKVVVTATPATGDPETAEAQASVTTIPADMTVDGTVTLSNDKPKVGDTIKVTATTSGQPAGATVTYKWTTGETTAEISAVVVEGKTTFKCDITFKADNYNDIKISRSKSITVAGEEPEVPADPDGKTHIWPLPHLNAAFMYGSWWALDEIQALTVAGKDWKTETKFTYQDEIDAFKKILANYTTVMVQESRNGRIIDRAKLESGEIY